MNTTPPVINSVPLIDAKALNAQAGRAIGNATMTEGDKKEINRLRSCNGTYDKFKPEWDLELSAYEGGEGFACKANLNRYPRENEQDFEARAKRLHYINYCAPLVDFFTTFIFSETIQRDGGKDADVLNFYSDFKTNVNRKGDGVDAFMKQVCDDMQIFGMSYVLVDAPKRENTTPLSVQQEKELGLRPYWVLVRPTEILDWVTNEFDEFQYIKRQQFVTEMQGFTQHRIERYTEWTPTDIKISDIDITEKEKPVLKSPVNMTNGLQEVPFEVLRYKRSKEDKFMGVSFLRDLAANNKEVMNITSMIQEFLYKQCFNILAMETDPNLPLYEQHDGEVGMSNLFLFPKGSHPPSFIAPHADPAKYMSAERGFIVQEMYRRAAEDTANELFSGSHKSGFSQSQNFKKTVPQIATRADVLEKAENRLMERTLKYMDKKWDGAVKYKDHYEITNLTDALAQLGTMFKELGIKSDTFARAEMKRIVHEFDGKLSTDDTLTIEKEIDAMDMEEWFTRQTLAFIGRAALAPEAQEAVTGVPAPKLTTSASQPVKGKDTATAGSTATKPSQSSASIKAAATKTPKAGK
jgi:hypothetical protein